MRQVHPARLHGATTICKRRERSRPCSYGRNGGELGTGAKAICPAELTIQGTSAEAAELSNGSNGNTANPPRTSSPGTHAHGTTTAPVEARPLPPELLALRRAGARSACATPSPRTEEGTLAPRRARPRARHRVRGDGAPHAPDQAALSDLGAAGRTADRQLAGVAANDSLAAITTAVHALPSLGAQ